MRNDNADAGWPCGGRCEAGLLLHETQHRTANEIAAALAALRLADRARGPSDRADLIGCAIRRLEGFGDTQAILGRRASAPIALSTELERLCRALMSARDMPSGATFELDLDESESVDARLARRVLLVAAELINNALRHALLPHGGSVTVRLRADPARLHLLVADEGPGIDGGAATSGTGLGASILEELVANGGGVMDVRSGPFGTAIAVTFMRELGEAVRGGNDAFL